MRSFWCQNGNSVFKAQHSPDVIERLGMHFPTQAAGHPFATHALTPLAQLASLVGQQCIVGGGRGNGWGSPATRQHADLSSVPIDKAQHRRAPEISQRRGKNSKTHTVRRCANCLW